VDNASENPEATSGISIPGNEIETGVLKSKNDTTKSFGDVIPNGHNI
jgi:hypothetical protein